MLERVLWRSERIWHKMESILFEVEYENENIIHTLRSKGFTHFPSLMKKALPFAGEVHNYILEKAKQDLPPGQFHKDTYDLSFHELKEIGGIIGYDGNIFEIYYNKSSEVVIARIFPPIVTVKHKGHMKVMKNELIQFKALIQWHSRYGYEDVKIQLNNLKDAESFLKLERIVRQECDVKSYDVIYAPYMNRFFWYEPIPINVTK